MNIHFYGKMLKRDYLQATEYFHHCFFKWYCFPLLLWHTLKFFWKKKWMCIINVRYQLVEFYVPWKGQFERWVIKFAISIIVGCSFFIVQMKRMSLLLYICVCSPENGSNTAQWCLNRYYFCFPVIGDNLPHFL